MHAVLGDWQRIAARGHGQKQAASGNRDRTGPCGAVRTREGCSMKADAKTEAEVKAVLTKMTDSYKRKDMEALMACFAPDPDIVFYGTGADEKRIGPDGVRMQAQRDWDQTDSISMVFDDVSISSAGPVAWAAIDGAFEIGAGGQEFAMPARVTMVLEERNGSWLIMQGHFSAPAAGQGQGESIPG
jgi:ketosteroid isomerase-like protein